MNRQYVGARYVPKFANPIEWDNKRSYEALTIVTYLGTSYTSKKTVPVGIEINDGDYWVVTGNYNAQIDEYRKEVNIINEKVNELYNLKNRKFILIGDSYGVNNEPTWIDLFKLGRNDTISNALGGVGFTTINSPKTFKDLFIEIVNTLSDEDKTYVTDVIVCGGFNDFAMIKSELVTTDDLIKSIKEFCDYVNSVLPNCLIHIGFMGWGNNVVIKESEFKTLSDVEIIYNTINYKNIHSLNNLSNVCKCGNFLDSTNFHPNKEGQYRLYWSVITSLFGNNAMLNYKGVLTNNDVTSPFSDFNIPYVIINDSVVINTSLHLSNITGTTGVIIGVLNKLKFPYDFKSNITFNAFYEGTINGVEKQISCRGIVSTTGTLAVFSKEMVGTLNGDLYINLSFNLNQ